MFFQNYIYETVYFCFSIIDWKSFSHLIEGTDLFFVFFQGHGLFLNVNCLVNASFSINVLFYWSDNRKIVKIVLEDFTAGLPTFWWDHSNHSIVVFIFILSPGHKLEEVLKLFFVGFQNWAFVYFILNSKHLKICKKSLPSVKIDIKGIAYH